MSTHTNRITQNTFQNFKKSLPNNSSVDICPCRFKDKKVSSFILRSFDLWALKVSVWWSIKWLWMDEEEILFGSDSFLTLINSHTSRWNRQIIFIISSLTSENICYTIFVHVKHPCKFIFLQIHSRSGIINICSAPSLEDFSMEINGMHQQTMT